MKEKKEKFDDLVKQITADLEDCKEMAQSCEVQALRLDVVHRAKLVCMDPRFKCISSLGSQSDYRSVFPDFVLELTRCGVQCVVDYLQKKFPRTLDSLFEEVYG